MRRRGRPMTRRPSRHGARDEEHRGPRASGGGRATPPVSVVEPHFPVLPEFRGTSYSQRYELLLRKLVLEQLYDRAAFLMSTEAQGLPGYLRRARRRPDHATVARWPRRARGGRGSRRGMTTQLSMNFPVSLPANAYAYGERASGETHGVVLTRRHIVDLMLDLAGCTADRDLTALTLLQPACGLGAFLVPAVERLLDAAERLGRSPDKLQHAIRAFDVDPAHVAESRERLHEVLTRRGVSRSRAKALVEAWITPWGLPPRLVEIRFRRRDWQPSLRPHRADRADPPGGVPRALHHSP